MNVEAEQAGPEKARMMVALDKRLLDNEVIREDRRAETWRMSLRVPKGKHRVRVNFPNDFYDEKAKDGRRDRNLRVHWIEVAGPEGGTPEDMPATHARLITATPGRGGGRRGGRRAGAPPARHPRVPPPGDRPGSPAAGEPREAGGRRRPHIRAGACSSACRRSSSRRTSSTGSESVPERAAPGEVAALGDYELASRLSFFLWSSLPDDRLLEVAGEGKLSDPAVLRGEVDRMLGRPEVRRAAGPGSSASG